MKNVLSLTALLALMAGFTARAHHSFAIYDIDNRIERTGVLTKFAFTTPHIQLELVVEGADGSTETWQIETMAPGRWDRMGNRRDVAAVGESVTIQGWPARNGEHEMLLSAITTERGRTVIIDEVRQRRARTDIPETTVTQE